MNPANDTNSSNITNLIYGPLNYSYWWLAAGMAILLLICAVYLGIFIWTLPYATLQKLPLINQWARTQVQNKFLRSLQKISTQVASKELDNRQSFDALDKLVRTFLTITSGLPVSYLNVTQLRETELGPYARLLNSFYLGRYAAASDADIADSIVSAQDMIRKWSK